MNNIETKVYDLLAKKLENLSYRLVSVRYLKENNEKYLKIIIDKDGDINLDEIVKVSDLISPLLDIHDFINEKYVLDISSLGAEKEIDVKKLDRYLNSYVNIHLSHPYRGENNIIGTLLEVKPNDIVIEFNNKGRVKKITLERKYVDKANLAIKF